MNALPVASVGQVLPPAAGGRGAVEYVAPKFNTPPEPVKTGDAKPTTDAAPAVQERM